MKRVHQIVLIVVTLALSWLGMMAVHEVGHVLGAWTSGGVVSKVVLHPLRFSETVLSDNPHPLWEVWTGPVFGAVFPLAAWGVAAYFKASFDYLLKFFAGFCLLANGAYLGIGAFDGIADAGNLLDLGASPWQLWLFGAVCMPLAFLLWHKLGPRFGLGGADGTVDITHTYAVLSLLTLLILIESLFALA